MKSKRLLPQMLALSSLALFATGAASVAPTGSTSTGNWGAVGTWSNGAPTDGAAVGILNENTVTFQAGDSWTGGAWAAGLLIGSTGGPEDWWEFAESGSGTLNVTGGTLASGYTGLGYGGTTGTMNVSGGTVDFDTALLIGWEGAGAASLNISGGTVTINVDGAMIGNTGFTGTSSVNVSGPGILNLNGYFSSGPGNTGTLNVSGGTVNFQRADGNHFALGSTGVLALSGGQINATTDFYLGFNGDGTLNQSGGAMAVDGQFALGRDGGSGTFNQTGGTLTAGAMVVYAGAARIGGAVTATNVTMTPGTLLGGNGTITGSLKVDARASLQFSPTQTLKVNRGTVTFGGLGMTDIYGLDSSVPAGTYTLANGTATFDYTNVDNLGVANAVSLGGGKKAYFQTGGLQVVVVSEAAHTSSPASSPPLSHAAPIEHAINWPEFIGRHDLVWEETPLQWNEGGFIGNGQLGLMVFATMGDNRVDFHLGRCDVTDHRLAPYRKTSLGIPGANVMIHYPRLDLGRMVLRPAGKIQSMTMRQDLWNAELRGTITTDRGELSFRALTPRDRMVQLIEIVSTEKNADGSEARWRWEMMPGNPASPHVQIHSQNEESKAYKPNPPPVLERIGEVKVCVQKLLAGGDYATAWLEQAEAPGRATLFLSTANEIPRSGESAKVAAREVLEAAAAPKDTLIAAHREWWHAFYQKSFLTIPDPRLESFYWIQIYKMAASTREGGPAIDLHGPWFRVSEWPGIWWNLNIQLTYWPFPPANHMDLSATYNQAVNEHFAGLMRAFGGQHNMGDLAWALHSYWLHQRYEGNWTALRDTWLPKADRVFADYRKLLAPGTDGKLHLPPMSSPEYEGFTSFPDTNYNLALLRWLAQAMIEVNEKTAAGNPHLDDWRETLAKLVDYPVNKNGYMISANQGVEKSHRHFSHIIGFYPLFVMNADDPPTRQRLDLSIRHWLGLTNPDGFQDRCGYTLTAAASQKAALGQGDEALAYLNEFLDNGILKHKSYFASRLLANTLYVESGGRNPTIETPLCAANSVIELLLQSWGGKVRVFPAVPTAWKQTAFHDLRAQGAFLISAAREDGKTAWVSVESLAGEPLVLKVPDWSGPLEIVSGPPQELRETAPGEYPIALKKGERISLRPAGSKVQMVLRPSSRPAEMDHPYGVKKGQSLANDMSWPVEPMRLEQ